MGIINILDKTIIKWRSYAKVRQKGAIGDFWRNGGNEMLVKSLPISSSDLVVDGGGYKGEWTDQILSLYGSQLHIFEPVPMFYQELQSRYQYNNRVTVHTTALSNKNGNAMIALSDDGSSIFGNQNNRIEIKLESFAEYILKNEIAEFGCLKLNIEGSEFDVLDKLLELDLVIRIKCLLVQFHKIDDKSEIRRDNIQTSLTKTHTKKFDYPFVWERWDLTS